MSAPAGNAPGDCAHCGLPVPAGRQPDDPATPAFCCFGCGWAWRLRAGSDETVGSSVAQRQQLQLGAGIFLALNVMVFSWWFYGRTLYGAGEAAHDPLAGLFAHLLWLLSTVVLVVLGWPIFEAALDEWRPAGRGRSIRPASATLISLAVLGAYTVSVVQTVRGAGELYFDTAVIILLLVTIGRFVDATVRRRAARAGDDLADLMPSSVRREADDGTWTTTALENIASGDRLRILAGERIAVDAIVENGRAHLDTAALTGESRPQTAGPGDRVLAGSMLTEGMLDVTVEQTGRDRVIEQGRAIVQAARADRPPIQQVAD
ncbi:MAG: hypothetical protein R3336_04555, partial [Phycisphaeraceae bacterium]|nr:hypothetical protein [Phycisphaeraceae bacterium]